MTEKKPLIVLVGPTAVGKTSISIDVAKKLKCEVVSADSMQIYKYMDIGTAKINEYEKQGISHYLVDEVLPNEEFSVSDFKNRSMGYIDEIINKSKVPLVVGGTGLYINSLVYDLDFTKAVSNWEYRNKLLEEANIHGNEYIYEKLQKVDIESANRIHLNDTKRIIRALEIYHETGEPMSNSYKNFRKPSTHYDLVIIGLKMDREKLYSRIDARVDLMIKEGLIDEVMNLINMGFDKNLTSMQGLGYKELVKYLNREYTLEEAIEILKRDSRRFAKRQMTWFRRDERIHWINLGAYICKEDVVKDIVLYIKEKLKDNKIFNSII